MAKVAVMLLDTPVSRQNHGRFLVQAPETFSSQRIFSRNLSSPSNDGSDVSAAARLSWTLISPAESHLLRPTIAPDGRAYFLSALDADKPERLDHVRRWQGETNAGDVLWIPPWTWHRVSYVPNVTALSASLFHFRPRQFVCENSIFALLSIPNIFKELVGMKTQ